MVEDDEVCSTKHQVQTRMQLVTLFTLFGIGKKETMQAKLVTDVEGSKGIEGK